MFCRVLKYRLLWPASPRHLTQSLSHLSHLSHPLHLLKSLQTYHLFNHLYIRPLHLPKPSPNTLSIESPTSPIQTPAAIPLTQTHNTPATRPILLTTCQPSSRSFMCPTFTQPLISTPSTQQFTQPLVSTPSTQQFTQPLVSTSSTQQFTQPLVSTSSTQRFTQPLVSTSSTQRFTQPLVSTSSTQQFTQPLVSTSSTQQFTCPPSTQSFTCPSSLHDQSGLSFLDDIIRNEETSVHGIKAQLDRIEASMKTFQDEVLRRLDELENKQLSRQPPIMPSRTPLTDRNAQSIQQPNSAMEEKFRLY